MSWTPPNNSPERARAIREQLGNVPGLAMTYGQLGLLALQRGASVAALEWTIRCIALFPSFPHPAAGPAPFQGLARRRRIGPIPIRRPDDLHCPARCATGNRRQPTSSGGAYDQ